MKGSPRPPSDSTSLWRNRDFVILWSGQLASAAGSQVSGIAFPLLVLGLTHSPAQAGLVGACGMLPFLVLNLVAGALVDRWDRKTVMIVCDVIRSVTAVSIPVALWLGHLSPAQLYVAALISGTAYVFFFLSQSAALPQVVAHERLSSAIAQNEAGLYGSNLIGPPLGGLLFELGKGIPFLIDAISYLASVTSLLFIRSRFQSERVSSPGNFTAEITAGLRWVWHHRLIRFMVFLWGGGNFVGAGSGLTLIVLMREMHASPTTIGLIFSLGSAGGVAASVLAPRISGKFSFGQVTVAGPWIMALAWALFALSPDPLAVGAVFALLLLVPPVANTVQMAYQLAVTPDELRGRVSSAIGTVTAGVSPLGQACTGILLQRYGPRPTIVVFLLWTTMTAVAVTLNRDVRSVPATEELRG